VIHAAWTSSRANYEKSQYGRFYKRLIGYAKQRRTVQAEHNPMGMPTTEVMPPLSEEDGTVDTRTASDLTTMMSLYEAGLYCALACVNYTQNPSQAAYAYLYDAIVAEVTSRTDGIFGDHAMKLVLEILICSGHISSTHVCKWPTNCCGYQDAMNKVFPGLQQKDWLAGFHYLYKEVGGHLKFAEVIMQLVEKRRHDPDRWRKATAKLRKVIKKQT
jgi:hypothetical protein